MSEVVAPEKEAAVKVAVMNQLPGQEPRAESPLHHADLETVAKKGPKQGGVYLQELKLLGHLVLRGSVDNAEFMSGAEKVLGVALPSALQSAEAGDLSVRWISPDEWLVIVPGAKAFKLERELRDAMGGHFAIVNVSGGQTVLTLSGPNAEEVLKKTTPYDVHPSNFPVGKVITSTFSKTQAVIRRTGDESFELVIRRSFADYAWLWLQDACAEYGLVVRG
ncbi:sarcosine oxidase subunit gamma [Marinobacterium jannaschii]|uniref:sarcosine oxidase subunit gamma n=1 Tax=Marinobacterium jannaschii TaxID=64970 RepID=UPI0009FE3FCE|nr:sarcosine oxidase subunit gamma family protein [Marinobacterium jannaschii]